MEHVEDDDAAVAADASHALSDALARFWAVRACQAELQDHEAPLPAFVQANSAPSRSIPHSELRKWMLKVSEALSPPRSADEGGGRWLVVAIAVSPCSIEETALMLLAAEHRDWVYVPIDTSLPLDRQLELMDTARVDCVVTLPRSPLARAFNQGEAGDGDRAASVIRSVQVASGSEMLQFQTVDVMTLKRRTEESLQASVASALSVRNCWGSTDAKADAPAPLYVLFTSGSTGKPKGVLGTRAGAWNRMQWMWARYPFTAGAERVIRAIKLTFVDSVWEILGAFLQRVPLVHTATSLAFDGGSIDVGDSFHVVLNERCRFLDRAFDHRVTRFTIVPSVLEVLLVQKSRRELESALASLRFLLISGETLPLKLVLQLGKMLPYLTVLNLYGSTEVAGDVTCMEFPRPITPSDVDAWSTYGVPIGELDGVIGSCTWMRLVDESGTFISLPMDEPLTSVNKVVKGELWVSGHPVALGYISSSGDVEILGRNINNPEKAGVEQGDQHTSSRNWFKTGDICAAVGGKYLYFCGRRDRLVKVRGLRIQLEAVERQVTQALSEVGGQRVDSKSQVIAFDIDIATKCGYNHRRLVVCIVIPSVDDDQHPAFEDKTVKIPFAPCRLQTEICRWIAKQAGLSMVPHEVCTVSRNAVDSLPNGKLDQHGLVRRYNEWKSSTLTAVEGPTSGSDDPVVAFVKAQLCSLLQISDLEWESAVLATLTELGADSLLLTLLDFELKSRFPALEKTPAQLASTRVQDLIASLCSLDERDEHHFSPQRGPFEERANNYMMQSRKRKRRSWLGEIEEKDQKPPQSSCITGFSRSSRLSSGAALIPVWRLTLPPSDTASGEALASSMAAPAMDFAWLADLEKCVDASPLVIVVQKGDASKFRRAVIGSHAGIVVCIDIDTEGRQLWKAQLDGRVEASAALSIHHELVYVGTYAGTLFALNLHSGSTEWTYRCDGMIKAAAVSIDALGIVVVGAYDHKLHAVMGHDGAALWTFDVGASIFSSPVFVQDPERQHLLSATTRGDIVSLICWNDAPSLLWRTKLPAPVFAGISVHQPSDLAVVGCADGNVYGLAASSGEIRWTIATEKPVFSSPCLYNSGLVVIGSHDGHLRKIDGVSGRIVWSTRLDSPIFSSPTVFRVAAPPSHSSAVSKSGWSQDLKYASTAGDRDNARLLCCAATTAGSIYIIDEQSGQEFDCVRSLGASNATEVATDGLGELFSSPVVIDRFCLIGTRSNSLLAFRLTPGTGSSTDERGV